MHKFSQLSPNETYYWRVSAADFNGVSDWSKEKTFTTGVQSYTLQYSTDKNFKNSIVKINGITKTSYTTNGLVPRETY